MFTKHAFMRLSRTVMALLSKASSFFSGSRADWKKENLTQLPHLRSCHTNAGHRGKHHTQRPLQNAMRAALYSESKILLPVEWSFHWDGSAELPHRHMPSKKPEMPPEPDAAGPVADTGDASDSSRFSDPRAELLLPPFFSLFGKTSPASPLPPPKTPQTSRELRKSPAPEEAWSDDIMESLVDRRPGNSVYSPMRLLEARTRCKLEVPVSSEGLQPRCDTVEGRHRRVRTATGSEKTDFPSSRSIQRRQGNPGMCTPVSQMQVAMG